jgi:two-component system chemotaxis response regulator CheB
VPKIRILVVDDAVVFRRVLADALSSDPTLDVVGVAANGRIALERMAQVTPDIVILDVEMPEMDGLTTLAQLRKTYPRLPVIMFSALTERGAAATLDALALGATDYFTKPSGSSLEASLEVIREQLIPEIKAICKAAREKEAPAGQGMQVPSRTSPAMPASPAVRPAAGPIQVLAIGASAGGPNALAKVFSRLPADFPVPIVLVQHMPPMFTRLLAERLSAQSAIRVREGNSGDTLLPGQAWIAPGDHHMVVGRPTSRTAPVPGNNGEVRIMLNQDPPENSCRPAVDVLLRSVASTFGGNSLTVILTGMGQDGLRGCETLREAGGQILVQDEATSVVWGMPGAVARAGLADRVLPLSLIGDEIVRRVSASRAPLARGNGGKG